ncbi:MAG: hypothetical protein JSV84_04755 [Gemmatimonadota bacterium]|nr:MAG: hypothetical protein JSV84_04755 [Gemmatimonadota bacterium]
MRKTVLISASVMGQTENLNEPRPLIIMRPLFGHPIQLQGRTLSPPFTDLPGLGKLAPTIMQRYNNKKSQFCQGFFAEKQKYFHFSILWLYQH